MVLAGGTSPPAMVALSQVGGQATASCADGRSRQPLTRITASSGMPTPAVDDPRSTSDGPMIAPAPARASGMTRLSTARPLELEFGAELDLARRSHRRRD